MDRYVKLRELLVGVEGLALLRHLYDGSSADADQRLVEVRRLLDDHAFAAGEPMREENSRSGYGAWSDHYDEPGNPVIAIEEPAVWSLLDSIAPGDSLDAACGTGRHARHLVDLGHQVVGVDVTREMVSRARENVPEGTFVEADLQAIPVEDEQFDAIVCGLALAHVGDLAAGVAELGRVLRPQGRMIISVLHPFQAHLGWHAPFETAEGRRGFVREHPHKHADYFSAFVAAGLRVRSCVEPTLGLEQVQAKRRAFRYIPDATVAAYLGLPGVLVWEVEKV